MRRLPCSMPVLLVASAEDRLLPSLTEASRLRRLIPGARRVVRNPSLGPLEILTTTFPMGLSQWMQTSSRPKIASAPVPQHQGRGRLLCSVKWAGIFHLRPSGIH